MWKNVLAGCAAAILLSAGIAYAQAPAQDAPPASNPESTTPAPSLSEPTTAPPPASSGPPAAAAPAPMRQPRAAEPSGTADKRQECRREVRSRGLRGRDGQAQMAICLAEARLECTKQAATHDFGARERGAFIRKCMGLPERRRPGRDG